MLANWTAMNDEGLGGWMRFLAYGWLAVGALTLLIGILRADLDVAGSSPEAR